MRTILVVTLAFFTQVASAKEATAPATDLKEVIRVMGQLNVNTATRGQLIAVGLADSQVEALLRNRARGPIGDLDTVGPLPADLAGRLKTSGTSNLRRIRQLPLEIIEAGPAGPQTATR